MAQPPTRYDGSPSHQQSAPQSAPDHHQAMEDRVRTRCGHRTGGFLATQWTIGKWFCSALGASSGWLHRADYVATNMTCIHINECVYTYIYISTYIHIYTYIHIHIYIYTYRHLHIYIHIYIKKYIYTYSGILHLLYIYCTYCTYILHILYIYFTHILHI